MLRTGKLRTLIFLGAMLHTGGAWCGLSQDQQPASPASPSAATEALKEIHVDDRCRILPDPALVPPGKRPRLRNNAVVCHIESAHGSVHTEEMVVGNEKRRNRVMIAEQEYVLQDVTPLPLRFVVEQPVAVGWRVDSDPQPADFEGTTAALSCDRAAWANRAAARRIAA